MQFNKADIANSNGISHRQIETLMRTKTNLDHRKLRLFRKSELIFIPHEFQA